MQLIHAMIVGADRNRFQRPLVSLLCDVMGDLRCPTCDYDLRGLEIASGTLRCPECGGPVDLDDLAGLVVERRRRTREMTRDVLLFLALSPLLFAAVRMMSGLPLSEMLRVRLGGLLSVAGVALTGYIAVVLFVASRLAWEDLHAREQWIFAGVAAAIIVVVAGAASLLVGAMLMAAWIGAFRWMTRRYEL
jgi:hypothetical protein